MGTATDRFVLFKSVPGFGDKVLQRDKYCSAKRSLSNNILNCVAYVGLLNAPVISTVGAELPIGFTCFCILVHNVNEVGLDVEVS